MDKQKISESDIRKVSIALTLAKSSTITKSPAVTKKPTETSDNPKTSDISTVTTTTRRQPSWIYPGHVDGSLDGIIRRRKQPHPDTPADGKKVTATVQPEPKRAKRGAQIFVIKN